MTQEHHNSPGVTAVRSDLPKVRLPDRDWPLTATAAELGQHLSDKPVYLSNKVWRRRKELISLYRDDLPFPVSPECFRTLVERYVRCFRRRKRGDVACTMTAAEASKIMQSPEFTDRLRPAPER